MSEATPVESHDSTMKRMAKAFYAKVRNAASKIKAGFIRVTGDNETPIREDEGTARKIARRVLSVPKWTANTLLAVARGISMVVLGAAGFVGLLGFAVIGIVLTLVMGVVMVAYKLVHLLALILRTPYLLTRGGDVLKTDWVGYLSMWRPKYFAYTHISQVYSAQAQEAAERLEEAAQADLDLEAQKQAAQLRHPANGQQEAPERVLRVVGDDRTKGQPTASQRKRRPRRIPRVAISEA